LVEITTSGGGTINGSTVVLKYIREAINSEPGTVNLWIQTDQMSNFHHIRYE